MRNYLQDVDLSGDSLHVVHICDLVLLQDLYGYFLLGINVHAFLHLAERSLSECLCHAVAPDNSTCRLLLGFLFNSGDLFRWLALLGLRLGHASDSLADTLAPRIMLRVFGVALLLLLLFHSLYNTQIKAI